MWLIRLLNWLQFAKLELAAGREPVTVHSVNNKSNVNVGKFAGSEPCSVVMRVSICFPVVPVPGAGPVMDFRKNCISITDMQLPKSVARTGRSCVNLLFFFHLSRI